MSDLMNLLNFTARTDFSAPLKVPNRKHAFALILTPTRELALQVKKHMEVMNGYTKKHIKVIIEDSTESLTFSLKKQRLVSSSEVFQEKSKLEFSIRDLK